ncbi:MAG: hypothetical protein ACPH5G_19420, partial [Pseudooceanicola atlanticus]
MGPEYGFPGACRDRLHLVGVRVSVVGELKAYILAEDRYGKGRMRWFLIWVLTALPALAERGKAG